MPVRKRRNRRKPVAGAEAWECVFASEFDFFHDLRDAGVVVDQYGRPDREKTRTAWKRYGAEFLTTFSGGHTPWALTIFGEP